MIEPAVELKIVALIANIVTPLLFATVLIFQIRSTNAASRSAKAAETEAARLRPAVRPFEADAQKVNDQAVPGTVRFRVQNVGQSMAYEVHWSIEFFDVEGNTAGVLASPWRVDLPPSQDMYGGFTSTHEDWAPILKRLLANEKGLRYVQDVRYRTHPTSDEWWTSIFNGKPEYLDRVLPDGRREFAGWVWVMGESYTLDRPVTNPSSKLT